MKLSRTAIATFVTSVALFASPVIGYANSGLERPVKRFNRPNEYGRVKPLVHKWLRWNHSRAMPSNSVPELDRGTGAQSLALLLGASVLVLRRRTRRTRASGI